VSPAKAIETPIRPRSKSNLTFFISFPLKIKILINSSMEEIQIYFRYF